ncbi:response regulator transcription factor [Dawidia soli]|uniref:Response regulator transcription factor n=1 Tax=Dawidia soli TaxID=2782352 RepID=A0AAP2D581_9BACT|nr:response regulator transcription factor [Dawidia soli]MBT1685576.1 response regulator transcription factor [Dawidia soli]
MKVTIGIADDQQLFLKSLATLINTFNRFNTVLDALNGEDLLKKLERAEEKPEIILLDVNMPHVDGLHAAKEISTRYPGIKLIALSMNDDDTTIISMLKAGCCAYLIKDIHPNELEKALEEVSQKGYYNADAVNINFRRLLLRGDTNEVKISDRELAFLKLACTDLTYKQIASQMSLAERTIDGYRESLFEKLNVQSRVGMAMEAIRRKLVTV